MNTIMGQNKDAAIGFIGIGIIIAIIAGAVMILLPGESETQRKVEQNQSIISQENIVNESTNTVRFNPQIVSAAKESIPDMQIGFRTLLEKCNAIDSYSDYLIFATKISIIREELAQIAVDTDDSLIVLEVLGYDEHPSVGPLIKETRQLMIDSGKCLSDLVKEYEARVGNENTIQTEDTKLNTEDLQKIIAGFESYNKSVKMLLDMCGNVESENDFRLLGQLIAESGDDFIKNTSDYGAVRNKLMAEGYGEHSVLGPLMDQSVFLVDLMTTCMDVLAWEFSG